MEVKHKAGHQSETDPYEFVMSDETEDRVGDIIEARGWDLSNVGKNMPVLFGHDHASLVGQWHDVRVVGKKLIGKIRLAEKGTSALVDTVHELLRQKILRAVSVGFQPLEYEPIEKNGRVTGLRFKKQVLTECSLVSCPANPNALAIAKSCGMSTAAAHEFFAVDSEGQIAAPGSVTKNTKGTASRPVARTQKQIINENTPMSISAKIEQAREKHVAIKDELVELKALAEADEFDGFTEEQQDKIDLLSDEQKAIEKRIESLEKVEAGLMAKSQPALGAGRPVAGPTTGGAFPKEEKAWGTLSKLATAQIKSHMTKMPLRDILQEDYFRDDDRVKAVSGLVTKTAVDPASTTAAGWAAELVRTDTRDFLEELAPISVYAALRARSLGLDFGGANAITIPRRGGSRTDLAGAFVGEGGVIPVKRMTLASQTLNRYKMAVISAFTNEILEQSNPSIEAVVRRAMLEDTAVALDNALLDGNPAVAGVRPASILNGVTGTATSGATTANIITDMRVLLNAMQTANLGANPVLIMNSARLLGLSTVTNATGSFMFRDEIAQGRLLGVPVIASTTVPAAQVIIVDGNSFAAANDSPEFMVSDQTVLTMASADGTAPTQAEDGTGGLGTEEQVPPGGGISVHGGAAAAGAAGTGYEAVSMYQTYSTALRMVLPTSWGLVRTGAVDQITGVAW